MTAKDKMKRLLRLKREMSELIGDLAEDGIKMFDDDTLNVFEGMSRIKAMFPQIERLDAYKDNKYRYEWYRLKEFKLVDTSYDGSEAV